MKRGILLTGFLFSALFPIPAQSIRQMTDRYALPFMRDAKHVGLSVGILKDGKMYTCNYGSIDREKVRLPTARTIYEIASVTKSFTGILLAHALLEKRMAAGDDIRRYLPGAFPNLEYRGHPVTIADLAHHTAGFPKFILPIKSGATPQQINDAYAHLSRDGFYRALAAITPDTLPGVRYAYSNADAELVGVILENVYHQSYGTLVQRYICRPNKMKDTRPEQTRGTSRRARGYNGEGQRMPDALVFRPFPAAGFLQSTVSDLLRYLQLNLDEEDAAIRLSHQPGFLHTEERGDAIGLFWYSTTLPDGSRLVRHAGGSFGCTSYCMVCPARRLGIVCLANDAAPDTEHQLVWLSYELMTAILQGKQGSGGQK